MMAARAQFDPDFLPASPGAEEKLRLLVQTGLMLASERSLDVITQASLDVGRTLCDAQHGVFFYADEEQPGLLKKSSGSGFNAPADTLTLDELSPFFPPGDQSQSILHVDEARCTRLPFSCLPSTKSCISVPIRCHAHKLLGAMIYGHADRNAFSQTCEEFLIAIGTQAARAIENFRLGTELTHEIAIADSARSLQRETAERLRQALDAAELGTWKWDRATDILDLDERAARMFGVRSGDRISRTELRERIVVPEDLDHTVDRLQESLKTRRNYSAEYRIDNDSGRPTWVSSTGVPNLSSDSSEVIGMVGTTQDITARKVHEQTLRESEKLAATGRLAATIAHEINNPLEAITNLIYLSRTDPAVPEPVKELLETADAELARVSQIAQQTLGFYRDTTRPVKINMSDLLLSIAELFTRKMRSKGVSCTVDLERDFSVFGLQGEIRQVFSNLVVNAIDASSHSDINIRSRRVYRDGVEGLSVLIQDHGSGIPAPVRSQLFSPFVTTKQSVGTGLGLWVTRGIVEKQGGTIRFRTRTEKPTGTIFRVFLPAKAPVNESIL